MFVKLNDNRMEYSGRIGSTKSDKPVFIYPSSYMKFRFYGKKAVVKIKNHCAFWNHYIGIIVDGVQRKEILLSEGITTIVLCDEQCLGEHTVMVFKRMDACHEYSVEELELFGEAYLMELPPKKERKIEVYGDSVSAGEVSEAIEYAGKEDPEHQGEYSNSWYSYAWIAARKLNAEIHNIAQGGIALLNHTGWYSEPDYIGLESTWDKLNYNPIFGKVTDWNFRKYTPQIVIVAIGQNDSHPVDYMKDDYNGEKAKYWREKYKKFICCLREKYPFANIILTTTILNHNKGWDQSIEEVCKDLKDKKITHFIYRNNGCGTPGHIRIMEAEKMAEELSIYIENNNLFEDDENVSK